MTNAEESKSAEKRLSDDIPTLEAEIAKLTLERDNAIKSRWELMEAEDPKNGIFHHTEIFDLQQSKLRLEVDIQFRVNKINRINLGIEGIESEEPQSGFLF